LFALEGGFAYLMTHTISADKVAADLPPEQKNAELHALCPDREAQGLVR
jgi:hypothetical protein